jgi:sugar/nucleoside kinase (ribokinase family)
MMRGLAVMGNVNVDLIMGPATPWPTPGTEVLLEHDDLRPGGSAGNTALAWAGIGQPFMAAAAVGDDLFGRWLAAALAPHSRGWTVLPAATTLSVGLTHPDGERTFFTMHGHLPAMGWDALRPQLAGFTDGLLLLCGSFLTDRLTADYPAIFAWAAARRIELALDPGWPPQGWTDAQRTRAKGWLGATRHLLINEAEALALTSAASVDAALTALTALMPEGGTAVIKAGPRGAIARQGGETSHAEAPAVRVIDTIGAGDIFNAGYLSAIGRGASLSEALVAGTALASGAISTNPRRYALPDTVRGAV